MSRETDERYFNKWANISSLLTVGDLLVVDHMRIAPCEDGIAHA